VPAAAATSVLVADALEEELVLDRDDVCVAKVVKRIDEIEVEL